MCLMDNDNLNALMTIGASVCTSVGATGKGLRAAGPLGSVTGGIPDIAIGVSDAPHLDQDIWDLTLDAP